MIRMSFVVIALTLFGCKQPNADANLSSDALETAKRLPKNDVLLVKQFLNLGLKTLPTGRAGHKVMRQFYSEPRTTGARWNVSNLKLNTQPHIKTPNTSNKRDNDEAQAEPSKKEWGSTPLEKALTGAFEGMELFGATSRQYLQALAMVAEQETLVEKFAAYIPRLANARVTVLPTMHKNKNKQPVCISMTILVSTIPNAQLPKLQLAEDGDVKNPLAHYLVLPPSLVKRPTHYSLDYLATIFSGPEQANSQLAYMPMHHAKHPKLGELMADGAVFNCPNKSCTVLTGKTVTSPEECPVAQLSP